jgi:hypothetical protein
MSALRHQCPGRIFKVLLLVGFTGCVDWVSAADAEAVAQLPRYEAQFKPFLTKNCVSCHGPEKEKGDLRLDTLSPAISDIHAAEHWQNVLDAIIGGDMPPEDEPQPDEQGITRAIDVLTEGLALAQSHLADQGGAIILRRLNQREYRNTIYDLLGVYEGGELVEDGNANGFDTVGDAHFMSSVLIERYRQLGRSALDSVFAHKLEGPPKAKLVTDEIEEARKSSSANFAQQREKGLKTAQDAIDSGDDDPGWKKSRGRCISQLASVELYYRQPHTDEGFILNFSGRSFGSRDGSAEVSMGDAIPGTYRLTVHGGLTLRVDGTRKYLDVRQKDPASDASLYDYLATVEVPGTLSEPQDLTYIIEHSFNGPLSIRVVGSEVGQDGNIAGISSEDRSPHESQQKPHIWINRLSLEGPLDASWPPVGRTLIYGDGEQDKPADELEFIRNILERFTYEAFRHRPAQEDYLARLEQLFLDYRADGRSLHDAVLDTLSVVLASPSFAYLVEQASPSEASTRLLSGNELANRLSYFLWSRPPDTELYELAESRRLTNPAVLQAQVERMLDHKWSSALNENFTRQWLGLEDFDMIVVDENRFPAFNEPLRQAFRREPIETFAYAMKHDGKVTDLIDADFVVINGMLGDFYGIPGVAGSAFRRVELPKDSVRGGLLGQGAILTMTGDGERTSPIKRGTFVLRKLIDQPPPPPPPNVPQLEQKAGMELSVREQLEMHRNTPQCASCHRKIDPPGFALEHFDAIGEWRDIEVAEAQVESSKKEKGKRKGNRDKGKGNAGIEIDASGTMPDGVSSFTSHQTMKALINRKDMATGVAKAMSTYALGRRIAFSDKAMIDELMQRWETRQYGLRSLVHLMVASPAFRAK